MIVCHCKAVNDRAIRDVIRRGARSPREVGLACQAGRRCGGCIPTVRELLASETAEPDVAPETLPVVAAG
jgi:bacterioferritin-associated ferredoxin